MSRPGGNRFLATITSGGIAVIAIFGFLHLQGGGKPAAKAMDGGQAAPVESGSSADSDNPADEIRGVGGRVKGLEDKLDAATGELQAATDALAKERETNDKLKDEIDQWQREFADAVDERIGSVSADTETTRDVISEEIGRLSSLFDTRLREMRANLEQERQSNTGPATSITFDQAQSYPSGSVIPATEMTDLVYLGGLDDTVPGGGGSGDGGGEGAPIGPGGIGGMLSAGSNFIQTSVAELVPGGSGGAAATPGRADPAASVVGRPSPNVRSQNVLPPLAPPEPQPVDDSPVAVYTLPDLGTLGGASALTSLIGRVYRSDEDIVDAFPIKVLLGRRNFATQFRDMPEEIVGMVFGGYARGDGVGQCVRGYLTAATFLFDDGTIRSAYIGDEGTRPSSEIYTNNKLGYLSDGVGNPCLFAERYSDETRFLATRAALEGLEGYAEALRQQQIETASFTDGEGISQVESVIGSAGDFARASAYVGGIEETSDYIRELQEEVYTLLYVPSGTRVVVNLEQELQIDYDPAGRMLVHEGASGRYVDID